MLADVVVDGNKVYAEDVNGIVLVSTADNVTQIPYTVDPNAQKDTLGNIYSTNGTQALPTVPVIDGSGSQAILAQNETDAQPVAGAGNASTTAAATAGATTAPKSISPESIVIRGQWVQDSQGRDLILLDPTD